VQEAYRFITISSVQVDRSLVVDVWHRFIPVKVLLFVWRLLRDRLPTRDNLMRRRILHSNDMACAAGCGVSETTKHLLLDCGISNTVWYHVWQWLVLSANLQFLIVRCVIIIVSSRSWRGCHGVLTYF
jgi:hypothetical protein